MAADEPVRAARCTRLPPQAIISRCRARASGPADIGVMNMAFSRLLGAWMFGR